jgi:hypothetical protein
MQTLRGNLESICLTDVVQLLHVNRKTGKLYVSVGKRSGILFVLNGEVVHAETPVAMGESAAFDVLEWNKGEFEFVTTKFKSPTSIRRSVPDLLMESARTSDSRKHLRSIFQNLKSTPWPTMREPALTQGIKLFPENRKIIPYLDGYRNFLEIMSASEQSEITVLQTCLTLRDAGRLQVIEPEVSLLVVPLKRGLFKRSSHVEISKTHHAHWSTMGPSSHAGIHRVRISWPEGPVIEQVSFSTDIDDQHIAIPKELMQIWGLPEGIYVTLRPAP